MNVHGHLPPSSSGHPPCAEGDAVPPEQTSAGFAGGAPAPKTNDGVASGQMKFSNSRTGRIPASLGRLSLAARSGIGPWLLIGVIVVELLVATIVAATLFEERSRVEEQAAQDTMNNALALEQELAGIVRSSDLILQAVIGEYHRQVAAGGVDSTRLNDFVAAQAARLPEAEGIRLTDAAGTTRYGTDVPAGSRINVSDRPHFRSLAMQEHDGLLFSRPQRSRIDHKWQIVLARGMKNPDGSFSGMAFVTLPVERLTRTLGQMRVPQDGMVTLRGPDLGIIARYPEPDNGDDLVGQSTVSKEFTDRLKAGQYAGTFLSTAPLDGIERIVSFRKVADYPLYLLVGRARHEYLGSWQRSATIAAGALGLLAAMATGFALVAHRNRRRLTLAANEVRRLAHIDFVTDLMNRRALLEAAELELARARRYGKALSLLMIDVDHFKSVNETLGQYAGDKVLHGFAAKVRHALREVDVIGRWAGEEFVAVLPETDIIQAREVAERIRQMVSTTELAFDGTPPVKVTVSIGVTTVFSPDESIDAMIARAVAALQEAKNGGRNRVSC